MIEHIKWAYGFAPVPHWMRYDGAEQLCVRLTVYWLSASAVFVLGSLSVGLFQ